MGRRFFHEVATVEPPLSYSRMESTECLSDSVHYLNSTKMKVFFSSLIYKGKAPFKISEGHQHCSGNEHDSMTHRCSLSKPWCALHSYPS